MKRKTIQLAGKTLVLSLPSKWVKENNIHKGDELEVTPKRAELTITSHNAPAVQKAEINIAGMDYSSVWHYVIAAYCKGFEEIGIIFDKPFIKDRYNKNIKTTDALLNIIDGLIGMEIVRQGRNFCLIKEVSRIQKEEFPNMLRRLFFLIQGIADDSFEAVKNKDKSALNNILLLENNINKFSHYCLRSLKFFDNNEFAFIIRALEMLSDKYCFIIKNLRANELPYVQMLNELLSDFHEAFYNLNSLKLTGYHNKIIVLKNSLLKKNIENKHVIIDILDITMEVLNAGLFLEGFRN